jgi:hypothetical protein
LDEDSGQKGGRSKRLLALATGVVTLAAAAIGLAFTLDPGLKPCLGATSASFTGLPVFPRVPFRDYLVRNGTPKEEVVKEPNLLGAEVRFSYDAHDLRGKTLIVNWSLISIERDGTLGAVVPGQDRALAMTINPDACSVTGGKDLFVQIPFPGRRYRVVLELFRGRLNDRLALAQTAPFRG